MRKTFIVLLVGVIALTIGCGATAPRVSVLEVAAGSGQPATPGKDTKARVFLEVTNPTGSTLTLSRLHYRFTVADHLVASGEMQLARAMGADSAAVIRVPVDLGADLSTVSASHSSVMPCTLDGRLFATVNWAERAWDIKTECVIRGAEGRGRVALVPADLRVADADSE